jgi:hypothetical protein
MARELRRGRLHLYSTTTTTTFPNVVVFISQTPGDILVF